MRFNTQPEPLERALHAARTAVDAEPSNHRAFQGWAAVQFYRREFQAARAAAERAIALNPMDGCSIAHMGALIAYTGDWDKGCALVEGALELNPHHPGWFWFTLVYNAYRKGDYRGSLDLELKINMPGFFGTHMVLAAAYGQLGELDAANQAVRELLALQPNAAAIAFPGLALRLDAELVEHYMDGLRKAGLEIPEASSVTVQTRSNAADPKT